MKKEIIFSIIIALTTLLIGQGLVVRYLNAPRFFYDKLEIHRIAGTETHAYILQNAGRQQLKNLVIVAKGSKPISAFRFDGPNIMNPEDSGLISKGKIGDTSIELEFKSLVPKSSYLLTIKTLFDSNIQFTALTDETQAVLSGNTRSIEVGSIVLSLLSVLISVLAGVAIYKRTIFISEGSCRARRLRDGNTISKLIQNISESFTDLTDTVMKFPKDENDVSKYTEELENKKIKLHENISTLTGYSEIIADEGICFDGIKHATDRAKSEQTH